ncbi:MAG: hypothetical protein GWN29_12125, partial [Gammaproteobacteria bacterium]|nr:hypothetical protein [Gammaproteobacteria bacterium]
GDSTPIYGPDEAIAMELHGHRSVQRGPYKLVWEQAPGNTWWGFPIPEQWRRWQLYDLSRDPGEVNDISSEHPEIAAELAQAWDSYASAHGVVRNVSIVDVERWRQPRAAE